MGLEGNQGRSIASSWPRHEDDEIEAAVAVLRSGRVNARFHGEQCAAFEAEFAAYCGMPYAVAVANGTVALELALRAIGIGPGDEVIVPARSFFATASCVKAVGAAPVFADIDPRTHNIDPASVAAVASENSKAVIAVHLAGLPCDIDGLKAVCRQHGLLLIEDCAQAHGAEYRGRKAGSLGDVAAFSFCTDKIMSTGGEGGIVLLRDKAHWTKAWSYKDHGKNPAKVLGSQPGNEFRYVHDGFGTNWRLTELQAAIGRVQLTKLPDWIAMRRRNAALLDEALGSHPAVELLDGPEGGVHAYYKYYFMIRPEYRQVVGKVSELVGAMHAAGIPAATGSCPDMSLEGAFNEDPPRRDGNLDAARDVGRRTVMLPVDPTFDEADMKRMAAGVVDVLSRFAARDMVAA